MSVKGYLLTGVYYEVDVAVVEGALAVPEPDDDVVEEDDSVLVVALDELVDDSVEELVDGLVDEPRLSVL